MSALAALLAAGVTATAGADLPPEGLAAWRWTARPILIFAAPDDPRLADQATRLAAQASALEERRAIVIVETRPDGPLVERFRPDGFTVILIGLDGGEKFRAGAVTDPEAFDALIDAMPMRRRALRG